MAQLTVIPCQHQITREQPIGQDGQILFFRVICVQCLKELGQERKLKTAAGTYRFC